MHCVCADFAFRSTVLKGVGWWRTAFSNPNDLEMGTDRFQIDSKQVFLLLTGWLKHGLLARRSNPNLGGFLRRYALDMQWPPQPLGPALILVRIFMGFSPLRLRSASVGAAGGTGLDVRLDFHRQQYAQGT